MGQAVSKLYFGTRHDRRLAIAFRHLPGQKDPGALWGAKVVIKRCFAPRP